LTATLDDLVAAISDGTHLAVPAERRGVAMAATRALIRRGVKDLRLTAVPTSGLQADLLIGAGAVTEIETSAVSLGEYGPAPRFCDAVTTGRITIREATCPAIHAALQASEKGVPFMPLRGIIGSDIQKHRPDWRIVDNPLGEGGDPILLLPAIAPDVALFHVSLADRDGNVWVGRDRDLITMAHASRETLVSAETIQDANLFDDPLLAAGALSSLYVTAVAKAERGAWPLAQPGCYGDDAEHLRAYAGAAKTQDGFARYLDQHVFASAAA
jgi:glutaconate CoA-transferase subunit A